MRRGDGTWQNLLLGPVEFRPVLPSLAEVKKRFFLVGIRIEAKESLHQVNAIDLS
jgi:hypothetical protein